MNMKKRLRFLSARILVLAVIYFVALVLLVCVCVIALKGSERIWLLALPVMGVMGAGISFYFWTVRPFLRLERMMQLFLEGYTISGIMEEGGEQLSPSVEQMIKKVLDEYSSTNLLKHSKRQAQYRVLQSQINPHFLYNTLESIRSEALIAGLTSVADMTEALAVFFRYTISKVENLVSVEEELQNCETYFRIQQYRFGDRLQLHIECMEEERERIYQCRLPKLTLQPILENSIIHGTEFKIGAGNIVVRLSCTGDTLLIEVSDDGVGMDESTLARLNERLSKSGRSLQEDGDGGSRGGSVALTNVNNRIHLLFGEEYGLTVYSLLDVGTDVQIILPIILSDRNVMNREVV